MERRGLTSQEVQDRIEQGLVNRDASLKTKSVGRIILEHTLTLFNVVNIVLAVLLACVGSFRNMTFMVVVVANLAIGIFQEIRSKRMVDKLSLLVESKAEVIRDGAVQKIPTDELVVGDLVHVRRGAQIAADMKVLEGRVCMNESLLTGEQDMIEKKEGSELLSGSFVVSGDCYAAVIRVGKDNYTSKISRQVKTVKASESEIMTTLKKIITILSCILLPLGIFLYINQLSLPGATVKSAVVNTVAALISMIPEGLMLLTSTVLAVAVIRLSQKNVLVQQIYCIETLAHVDVLCLDKTGTLTTGKMHVSGMLGLGGTSREELSHGFQRLSAVSRDESPTMDAIREVFGRRIPAEIKATRIIDFSSETKWSGASFSDGLTYVLGAGEYLYGSEKYHQMEQAFQDRIGSNRVMNLAVSHHGFGKEGSLPDDLEPMGVLLIQDEIRQQAPDTIQYFLDQGVELKVISGDGAKTVSHIAEAAGIPHADKAVDCRCVSPEDDLGSLVENNTVFGRVSPEQKRSFVRALQKEGHTVAMTGDGVNDVLAMKEADCSVAMASGSDAARNIAQLVLTTDDFSAMPAVVAEGRRSINNIQRSSSMFLTKTIFAICLALFFSLATLQYPFEPLQMSFISVLTIGFPSVILALEPNNERISGNFFYNLITRALSGGISMTIGVLLVYLTASFFHLSYPEISTCCVMVVCAVGVCLLLRISIPFNIVRGVLFGLVIVGIIGGYALLGWFFSFVHLTGPMAAVIAICAVLAGTFFNLAFSYMEKVREKHYSPEQQARAAEQRRVQEEKKALRKYNRLYEWEETSQMYKGTVRLFARAVAGIHIVFSSLVQKFKDMRSGGDPES